MKTREERVFNKVTLELETEDELKMLRLIAHNVQPSDLASWSESVSQAQATTFLVTLHEILSRTCAT